MTAPLGSNLQWFPAIFSGGIVDSTPIAGPQDFARLDEIALFRGRLAVRAPLVMTANLVDSATAANITQVLALCYHVGKCYAVGHSSVTGKTYLYRLGTTGFPESGAHAYPIATVWTGAGVPRVNMVSFEGGSATAPKQRIYIADYSGTYAIAVWDSTASTLYTGATYPPAAEDFDNSGAKEALLFPLVFTYNSHMFGTDHRQATAMEKGLLRVSQPGLIPADEPGGNPATIGREWWNSDFKYVGSRGDSLTATGDAGGAKILYKRRQAWALYGYDISSFAIRPVSGAPGAVGPQAVANLPDGTCVAWGDRGPFLCNGQTATDIGEPIRKRINAVTISQDTCLGYSPDDGLLYCVVPGTAGAPDLHLAWDPKNGSWLNEGTWKGLSVATTVTEAFTDSDAVPLPTHDAAWSDVQSAYQIWSNKAKNVLQDDQICQALRTVTGSGAARRMIISVDATLPTAHNAAQVMGITARKTGGVAYAMGIRLMFAPTSATHGTMTLSQYGETPLGLQQTTSVASIAWAAAGTMRMRLVAGPTGFSGYIEPAGGGAPTASASLTYDLEALGSVPYGDQVTLWMTANSGAVWDYQFDNWACVLESGVTLAANDIETVPDDTLVGPVAAPSLVAVAVTSDTELTLSWVNGDTAIDTVTDIHQGATGFTPSAANLITTVTSGVAAYLHTGRTPKTTYYYKLIHRRNGTSSAASAQASGLTALAKPTLLTASSYATGIHLAFTHNANASDWVVQRKPPGGSFSNHFIEESDTTSGAKTHDDTVDIICGLTYVYRIYAQESPTYTNSPYSNEASWVSCSTAPTLTSARHRATIAADCPAGTNVAINWVGIFKSSDTILIERNEDGAGYVERMTVPAQDLQVLDTWGRRDGVTSQTLRYRLTAYDGGVVAGTPVETTQTAHNVDVLVCPE